MLQWDRLRVHNARLRFWRWVVDEIVHAPLEPILHPSTARLQWLGVFTFGGHFIFGWLWGQALPQPYELFAVRVVLALTGLLLLHPRVNRDLQSKTSVWVYGLIFWLQLPLFFGWMFLMNEGNKVWLASVCSMILIYFHITDWRLASLGCITGFAVAAGLFLLTGTQQTWVGIEPENLTLIGFALGMSLMLGMSGANLRRVRLINTLSTMGVMAHELRTPLATIDLMGDVLHNLAQHDVPETRQRKLADLAQRLHQLVRTMHRQIDTQIFNAQLQRLPREQSVIMAGQLVRDAVEHYPYRSGRERDCVRVSIQQDFCFRGSPQLFSQVLANLIKNALHSLVASSGIIEAGDLQLTVGIHHGQGRIAVADQGMGMTQEQQQRIFEPFYSTQAGAGSGLGLTFCRNVVDTVHGKISVHSQPGRGAIFMIDLPLDTTPGNA